MASLVLEWFVWGILIVFWGCGAVAVIRMTYLLFKD